MAFKVGDVFSIDMPYITKRTLFVIVAVKKDHYIYYDLEDNEYESVVSLNGYRRIDTLWLKKRYKRLIGDVDKIVATYLATEADKLNRGQL